MSWVYIDGAVIPEAEATVGATDRAVLHGRGLFETFRVRRVESGGKARLRAHRLAQHFDRLKAGACVLDIAMPLTRAELESAIEALVQRTALDDARVRLTLTAGTKEGARGSVLIQARAADDYPEHLYQTGVSAIISTIRRNETSPLSRLKSLNYLDNMLARDAARRSGATEALLLNTHAQLAEGSSTNIFIVRGRRLLTPPVDDGVLPGITRRAVLDIAAQVGIDARELSMTQADLAGADEAFLTNAVAGILPLVAVDDVPIGNREPGLLTLRLRDLYLAELQRADVG